MSDNPVTREFVITALSVLEREQPPVFGDLVQQVAHAPTDFYIGREAFHVAAASSGIEVSDHLGDGTRVACNTSTLLGLLDGTLTQYEALRRDLLFVQGRLIQLRYLEQGLNTFLRAGIRSPEIPGLLVNYRNSLIEEPDDGRLYG